MSRSQSELIVGGRNDVVIEWNGDTDKQLRCEQEVKIITGAPHLFEEPGTLEAVAKPAAQWFKSIFRSKIVRQIGRPSHHAGSLTA